MLTTCRRFHRAGSANRQRPNGEPSQDPGEGRQYLSRGIGPGYLTSPYHDNPPA